MTWHHRAACVSHPKEWWYPERWNTGSGHGYAQARIVCQACPVRENCLTEALERNEQFGMWGGMTPQERGVHNNKCGTTAGYIRHWRAGEPPCEPCLAAWRERSGNERRKRMLSEHAEERRSA